MDERNQDFKNLGLIFSSRWDMTMTDIILHNNSADKDVLLKKDKTQQLIRSCCVIVCLSGSGRHFSQTAPVSRSYRCFPNQQAALQSVNYRLRALSKMRSALREVWLRNSCLSVCGLAQTQPPDMLRLTLCLTSIKSEERAEREDWGNHLWRCCSNSILCPWANRARVIKSHGHVCLLALASRHWPRRWSGRRLMQRFMDVVFFFVWSVVLCTLLIDSVEGLFPQVTYTAHTVHTLYTHTHNQTTRLAVRVCVWLSTLPRCKLAGFVGFKPNLWIFLFCCKLIIPQENTGNLSSYFKSLLPCLIWQLLLHTFAAFKVNKRKMGNTFEFISNNWME